MSLLLPIVLAAVAVFILSMIVHMAMPWHKSDYANVPDHDAAIAAIQSLNLAPDDYAVPNPQLPGGGKNPNFIAAFERGPIWLGGRGGLHVDGAEGIGAPAPGGGGQGLRTNRSGGVEPKAIVGATVAEFTKRRAREADRAKRKRMYVELAIDSTAAMSP
jgi:hypothetical protein